MIVNKTDIISQLQRDILSLQGYKTVPAVDAMDVGLGPIANAFPNGCFPLGAVHEFISATKTEAASSGGFIAGLLSSIMKSNGVTLWISTGQTIFPPGLKYFGVNPDQVIFVNLQKELDVLWALEEGLKCAGLAAVVGEMPELSFTTSRRLQLAVEQSGVTGFIIRNSLRKLNTTACESRWKINSLPSEQVDGLPGIGFQRWKIELMKVRNGKPGTWELEWAGDKFQYISRKLAALQMDPMKKTG